MVQVVWGVIVAVAAMAAVVAQVAQVVQAGKVEQAVRVLMEYLFRWLRPMVLL